MQLQRQRKRRALGQHYLVDSSVVAAMVSLAAIGRDDRVLEIGTGRGALTRRLLGLSSHFEAFEVDESNYLVTRELVPEGVEIHMGDAFAESRAFDILVSSLPYSESSNFVEWLSTHRYKKAVVLLQRDFVKKLLAEPGDDRYRAVSVVSQISSEVRWAMDVPRESFEPPPKVASAVVVITPRDVLSREKVRLVKLLFSQRRRRLAGALRQLGLRPRSVEPERLAKRVQELTPSDFGHLLDRIRTGV